MRKALTLVAVAVLALSATGAMAALTWDFSTGMQGWTWSTAHAQSVPGQHINGMPPEIIPGQGVYGAGGSNLYCPGDSNSRSTAVFDVSPYLVGGKQDGQVLAAGGRIYSEHAPDDGVQS